jgi:hypothetical protein
MRSFLLLCAFILTRLIAFAQQPQHVLKNGVGFPVQTACYVNVVNPVKGCDVTVWGDKDTERLISTARQGTDTKVNDLDARLRQQITMMQASIKTLSDANDALTKRVNDLETKLKK